MKNQAIAAILMAAFAAPAFADNFETQVFNNTPEQQVQVEELSQKEMKETEGEWVANAIGAIAGGIGGHLGYMAGAVMGGSYNFNEHMASIGVGALLGAANPVEGVGSALTTLGGTAVGTGIVTFAGRTGTTIPIGTPNSNPSTNTQNTQPQIPPSTNPPTTNSNPNPNGGLWIDHFVLN